MGQFLSVFAMAAVALLLHQVHLGGAIRYDQPMGQHMLTTLHHAGWVQSESAGSPSDRGFEGQAKVVAVKL